MTALERAGIVDIASEQGDVMGAEARLTALGIELPAAPRPLGSYVTAARSGNLLFTSGHGPLRDGRVAYQGKVGRELTIEQGQEAARLTGLNLLATVRDAIGSLDRVRRVVKVLGMVQCADDFTDQPKVINGFSDLMVEVFGDTGRHARSAVGMGSLPFGIPVEIEMIVEVSGPAGSASRGRKRTSTSTRRRPRGGAPRRRG
jgi:enamine deaminase RidA (YjgF/YER057c/UK114 family)